MLTLKSSAVAAVLLTSFIASASGLDRDSLMTEAPATPDRGTVRVSGGGSGGTEGAAPGTTTGTVSGAIMWTPVDHLAGDVGAYFQDGTFGPSARVRYQVLSQEHAGIDLSVGARFKVVGFSALPADQLPPHELELVIAGGHRFGRLDVILNAVIGSEIGGPGKDAELKMLVGYNFVPELRLSLDGRLQAEFVDENGTKVPQKDDLAYAAGPTVSWMITRKLQIQGLVGMLKAKGPGTVAGLGGQAAVSFDF